MTVTNSNSDRAGHYNAVRKALIYILGANLLVTIVKIVLGLATGALSVIADGFHSLVDSSSNLIGLAAINFARRPADDRHPYGYSRYETLGSLAIGAMLLVAAYEITSEVINRFLSGEMLVVSPLAFWIMLATLPVNILVVILEKRAGRKLGSEILMADAKHTQSDLFVTASVLVSLMGAQFGLYWLDGLAAAVVVVMIVRAAFDILGETSRWLADTVMLDAEEIDQIASSVPGVRYVHNIRSRGTPDAIFIDLHAKVNPGMSTSQAHAVASEIERRLVEHFENATDAIVHIEPAAYDHITQWEKLRFDLRSIADGLGLGLHDLHVHSDAEGQYTVEAHLEIHGDASLKEAHDLSDEFEDLVQKRWPQAENIICHLEPLAGDLLQADEQANHSVEQGIWEILQRHLRVDQIQEVRHFCSGGHHHASITVHLPASMSLRESHEIAERIETDILKFETSLKRVTLHVEPERE